MDHLGRNTEVFKSGEMQIPPPPQNKKKGLTRVLCRRYFPAACSTTRASTTISTRTSPKGWGYDTGPHCQQDFPVGNMHFITLCSPPTLFKHHPNHHGLPDRIHSLCSVSVFVNRETTPSLCSTQQRLTRKWVAQISGDQHLAGELERGTATDNGGVKLS